MKLDTERFRVPEGSDADLEKRPTRSDPLCSPKEEYRSELDRSVAADSDEAARVFRTYSAHRSNLMPPTILI